MYYRISEASWLVASFVAFAPCSASAFQIPAIVPSQRRSNASLWGAGNSETKGDNKAMQFLKKIGKVGGSANKDFRFAIGIDEGAGKSQATMSRLRKNQAAYTSCVDSGIIDDMSEIFPMTSSGTQWGGFSDRVMGGLSDGNLSREVYEGRRSNVLRGYVSLENNGGFIQMATNLAMEKEDESSVVDASSFDGVELDVLCRAENEEFTNFNVHLKTLDCPKPYSSYRACFTAPIEDWATVRIPWSSFEGRGPGAEDVAFDRSKLRRAGIVAIGKEMRVTLALSGFRFYAAKNKSN